MRRLQEQGKARYIGITGYSLKNLVEIAGKVKVDSILSYCRYNLLITDMDRSLAPFAKKHGIGLINASPLHMGIITERGAPEWHPAPQAVRDAGQRLWRCARSGGWMLRRWRCGFAWIMRARQARWWGCRAAGTWSGV